MNLNLQVLEVMVPEMKTDWFQLRLDFDKFLHFIMTKITPGQDEFHLFASAEEDIND